METQEKYRLVTRSNLDGIISAVLLKKLDMIDDILFVHPKDVQDGKIEINSGDIVTNLPYVNSAHMAFDHKLNSADKNAKLNAHHVLFTDVPSASQIIYEYYGGDKVFDSEVLPLIAAANKSKSADFTKEEILSPTGWELLTFLSDPRTGLGRFREFEISNYELMKRLIDLLLTKNIDEVLETKDVKERLDLYIKSKKDFSNQLKRCVKIENDIAVIDLRDEEIIHVGNRFVIYALFPKVSASIHILQGVGKKNIVFALGKSIINKSNKKDILKIVTKYGGGGHSDAGTIQVSHLDADAVKLDLVASLG